jgi:hypothetical protein
VLLLKAITAKEAAEGWKHHPGAAPLSVEIFKGNIRDTCVQLVPVLWATLAATLGSRSGSGVGGGPTVAVGSVAHSHKRVLILLELLLKGWFVDLGAGTGTGTTATNDGGPISRMHPDVERILVRNGLMEVLLGRLTWCMANKHPQELQVSRYPLFVPSSVFVTFRLCLRRCPEIMVPYVLVSFRPRVTCCCALCCAALLCCCAACLLRVRWAAVFNLWRLGGCIATL